MSDYYRDMCVRLSQQVEELANDRIERNAKIEAQGKVVEELREQLLNVENDAARSRSQALSDRQTAGARGRVVEAAHAYVEAVSGRDVVSSEAARTYRELRAALEDLGGAGPR